MTKTTTKVKALPKNIAELDRDERRETIYEYHVEFWNAHGEIDRSSYPFNVKAGPKAYAERTTLQKQVKNDRDFLWRSGVTGEKGPDYVTHRMTVQQEALREATKARQAAKAAASKAAKKASKSKAKTTAKSSRKAS